ncbi:hypothetical protein [Amycolatopsis magusensis]|uniref:hypothetical protein n=1 Tax=Amycolatopsis magusensis TaxID=882444 RepID=UPI00378908D9
MTLPSADAALPKLRLTDLKPYLSVILLECTADDPQQAFGQLHRFLREAAGDPGGGDNARLLAEVDLRPGDLGDEVGSVDELGVEQILGIAREVTGTPGWAEPDAGFVDVTNQLSVAVRRHRLVAVYSTFAGDTRISRWLRREAAPFRFVPSDRLTETFRGDGKMLWLRGGQRRPADADAALEDGQYALSAAKVAYLPDDESALLRDLITVSPGSFRVSWKRTSPFAMFLAAVGEVLRTVELALSAEEVPAPRSAEAAVPRVDLGQVRGAYDVLVQVPADADEERAERAELIRSAILDVRGDSGSTQAFVDVGRQGAVAGTLVVKPVEDAGTVRLDVRFSGVPATEGIAREVKEAIADDNLLTVYYESGHLFDGHQVVRRELDSSPYPDLAFEDFSGFAVMKAKPATGEDQAVHHAIATHGDDSLYAWVVRRFGGEWLLCDDGAGEVADFLHLTDDGTLTAIHVSAAHSAGRGRRIAVTPFAQVVSRAVDNIRLLDTELLAERLSAPRIATPAAWHAGNRITSAEFVHQLKARVATDRTRVVLVQPHLLRASHDLARADFAAGRSSRDVCSLTLLDEVLHHARRTVTALWDDLFVIGSE